MTPPHDHYNDVLQLLLTRLDDLQEGQNRLTDKVDDGFSKMNGRK